MADFLRLFDHPPSKELEPYVIGYDLVEVDGVDSEIPGIALPTHALAFCYGDPAWVRIGDRCERLPAVSVRSVIPSPWSVTGAGRLAFVFARLKPPSLYHLIRDDVSSLTGHTVDVASLGVRPSPSWVIEALRASRDQPVAKLAIVESYMRSAFLDLPQTLPAVVRLSTGVLRDPGRIATGIQCSERHLRREFLRYVGVSPKPYLDMLRVEAACVQLSRPRAGNLTSLAVDLEFYDLSHFNKTFRRYTGMSPSAFLSRIEAGPVGVFHTNEDDG